MNWSDLRTEFFAGFDSIQFPANARWCASDAGTWDTYGNASWPSNSSAPSTAFGLGVQAANTVAFLAGNGITRFRDLSFTAAEDEPGSWWLRWVFCARAE